MAGRIPVAEKKDQSGSFISQQTVFGKQIDSRLVTNPSFDFGLPEFVKNRLPIEKFTTPAPGQYEIKNGLADRYLNKEWKVKVKGARLRMSRKKY